MSSSNFAIKPTIIFKYLIVVFVVTYTLFHILNQLALYDLDRAENGRFVTFIIQLVNGEVKTQNYDQTIVMFGDSVGTKSIGPALLQTLSLTIISLFFSFVLALFLNILVLFAPNILRRITIIFREILESVSGIPTIVLALLVYVFLQDSTPFFALILILAIGNNIFYEFSSEQLLELKTILNMDFVTAAQAWGDSTWKHIRRSTFLNSIVQVTSMWIEVLANVLVVEIIFQKQGLGSIIFENIFASDRGSLKIEVNLLFSISVVIVLTVMVWNIIKDSFVYYLTEVRR